MAKRAKLKISKTRRIRRYFERLATYDIDDINRFRGLVAEAHAERKRSVKRLSDNLLADDDFFADHAYELDTISRLADELSIVALYRVVEVNTARMLAHEFGPAATSGSYKIDKVKAILKKNKGLVLDTIPHFKSIDKLRRLNNSIKHTDGKSLVRLDQEYERLSRKVPAYIFRLAERMKLRYK